MKFEKYSCMFKRRAPFLYTFNALVLHLSRRQREKDYLQDKLLVHVAFGHGGLEVRALQETQKELIHQLKRNKHHNITQRVCVFIFSG